MTRNARVLAAVAAFCGSWLACRTQDSLAPDASTTAGLIITVCTTSNFERASDCECLGNEKSEGHCEAMVQGWFAQARARGLEYDVECADRILSSLANFGFFGHFGDYGGPTPTCAPDRVESLEWIDCLDECQIYSGKASAGDPCEIAGRRMSDCAQGLACGADGRCHAPCDLPLSIPAGGPCGYSLGLLRESCQPPQVCSGDPGVCVDPLELGEACDPSETACTANTTCDLTTNSCEVKAPLGAACTTHADCASDVCDGTCLRADAFGCSHHYF